MTSAHACPSCGEADHLRGSPTNDGIEITCQRCAQRWVRGSLTCRSCGGNETLVLPRVIARTSRGNQLSIMGSRDITLCTLCDAEVIAHCKTTRHWVPEDYVSAFSFNLAESRRIQSATLPKATDAPEPPPEFSPDPTAGPAAATPTRLSQAPPPKLTPTENLVARPTVRQAIQDYMNAHLDADPLAMFSLGTHLGSSTRLETASAPGQETVLQDWFLKTWGNHDTARRAAVQQSIKAAFRYWISKGWLAHDPTTHLQT